MTVSEAPAPSATSTVSMTDELSAKDTSTVPAVAPQLRIPTLSSNGSLVATTAFERWRSNSANLAASGASRSESHAGSVVETLIMDAMWSGVPER